MTIEEIKKFLAENKDKTDVAEFLKSLSGVNSDNVKAYLETDEGKKIAQSITDARVTQAIETFKKNNLDKLINDGVSKKYVELHPEETADQKRIRELEQKFNESENSKKQAELKNKTLKLLTSKGMDTDILDVLNIGTDEDTASKNVGQFMKLFDTALNKAVTAKFKENGREPHKDVDDNGEYKGVNPWKKETFNLTEQAKLIQSLTPEIVAELKRAAGK
jgi:hypothetical protein